MFNKSTYLFLGGNFIGIKSKGWKLKFTNDAIEGIDIWIEDKTKDEMLWNYQRLSGYFNKVANFEAGLIIDSWIYCQIGNDEKRNCNTNIFMDKKKNKILINIFRNSNNRESIFIYN